MKNALAAGILALKEKEKEIPGGYYETPKGKRIYFDNSIEALQLLRGWAYSKLDSEDLVFVVRCKNCIQYKQGYCEAFNTYQDESFFCDRGMCR